jgi:hypothetical protein
MKKRKSILTSIANLANTTVLKSPKTRAMTVSQTPAIIEAFNRAWLMHIHRNPHHWQYWVLINDEPKEGTILIEMPYPYIIEMICDWWAFSWIKGDLSEMFAWYKDHADYIKMHNNTRSIVEEILEMIRMKLAEVENAEN